MIDARWRALAVLATARVAMGFQFQAVASVAPFLQQDMGLDYGQIGLLIGLFMLPGIAIALPGGLLGARFGDKQVTLVGLALLAIGGAICAGATSYPTLFTGRLLAGIGGVLLNVLMTKMVADWFAGREMVLAMSILINTWPIGIGLALLGLGPLAQAAGWGAAFALVGTLAAAGLMSLALFYRPSPDAAPPAQGLGLDRLSRDEFRLVCLAAIPWTLYNGAYASLVAFLPTLFLARGHSIAAAGSLAGLQTLVIILSVQAGGILVQRFKAPNFVVAVGMLGWAVAIGLLLFSPWPLAMVILAGLIGGIPAAVLVSTPAEVLRPASRGPGNGVFYTIFYLGMAVYPPIAGRLLDLTGAAEAPILFAALTMLACLAMLGVFRAAQRRYLLVLT